ncbi:ribonuclease H-like domain-containing protein [Tanacetum coccineum]
MDGTLSRYKARLVANGSTQLEGVDVDETFSLVVKLGTIRTVLSLAVSRHWPIHHLDVKNAFLHGDLSETVYMHQPPRFWDFVHRDYVCLLQRQGIDTAYLLLYVDDIVLTASSDSLLQRIISSLHQEFAMTDLGPLNYFLGIFVTRDSLGFFISKEADGDPISDPTLYQSLVGSLQYLTFTRPDITYVVKQIWLPILMRIGLVVPLLEDRLQGIVYFLATTYSLCPLSVSRRFLVLVQRQSIVVLPMLLLRLVGYAIYCVSCILLLSSATLVYYDNVSAVYLSCNPVQHQRTKHIEIDIYFVRDLVAASQVRVFPV